MKGKSLFYRWFGLGKIPEDVRETLESEEIILSEEGLPGVLVYHDFRAPGRIHSHRTNRFAGSIILTEKRFIAFVFSKPVINIPWGDERMDALDMRVARRKQLVIRFDVQKFHPDWSGTIECRFKTPKSERFLTLLRERSEGG